MGGSDFAAVVCSETLSHCSTSVLPEERHSRPYRWSRKHDDLLLLAHMPYDVERIKQYLEFYQLLVCSSEWLEYPSARTGGECGVKQLLTLFVEVGV